MAKTCLEPWSRQCSPGSRPPVPSVAQLMPLANARVIAFKPDDVDPAGLMEFYAWHLLNAAPGHIVQTLRWEAPYDYEQTLVGVLVLVYSLLFAAPLAKYVARA